MHPNLPKLVQCVFSTSLDNNANVRNASLVLIKLLVSQLSGAMIEPFFKEIVAHLRSALTSIDENVQHDALKLYDLYMEHYVDLLLYHIETLLPLLMNTISAHLILQLVSKSEFDETKSKQGSFKSQVATQSHCSDFFCFRSKLVSLKSRLRVLRMICLHVDHVITSLGQGIASKSASRSTSHVIDVAKGCVFHEADVNRHDNVTSLSLCHLASGVPYVPIVSRHGVVIPDVCAQSSTTPLLTITDFYSDYEAFLLTMNALGIVAVENWMECSPAQVFATKTATIQQATLMNTVMKVFCGIVQLLSTDQAGKRNFKNRNQLMAVYEKIVSDVSSYFVRYFPFSFVGTSCKEQLQQLQYSTDFTFCLLVMTLGNACSVKKRHKARELTVVAIQYLSDFKIEEMERVSPSSQFLLNMTKIICEFIPVLCAMTSGGGDAIITQSDGVFRFVRDFYAFCHPQSASKHLLIECLSNVFVQEVAKCGKVGR